MKKILLLTLLFVSCVSTPPPSSTIDRNCSLIGISVYSIAPLGWQKNVPSKILFVKLNNVTNKTGVIVETNYQVGNMFYIVNAQPGIYLMIGIYEEKDMPKSNGDWNHCEYLTIINDKAIISSQFEVKPSSFTYLGEYFIKMNFPFIITNINKQYYEAIKYQKQFRGATKYEGDVTLFDNSIENKKKFINKSKSHFKNTQWTTILL